MIVTVLSTWSGHCHPLRCGRSGKAGNGVPVGWEWEVIGKERKGRVESRVEQKEMGSLEAKKESVRKKDVNAPSSSPQT